MASSRKELEELHKLITKSYTNRIEQDLTDNIPTDAATLSGAVKFLKDNAVTADPADQDDLRELREALTETANRNRERAKRRKEGTLELVKGDLDVMNG